MTKIDIGKTRNRKWAWMKRMKENKWLLAMCAPAVLILLVFSYMPMVGIVIAFQHYDFGKGILGSQWVGFDNFRYLFSSSDAWRITYNTLFLNAMFIILGLIFSVFSALLLNEVKNRFLLKLYQSIAFYPYFISWVLVGFFVYGLLSTEKGALNHLLIQLGFQGVNWYASPQYWPAILILASIWKSTGYYSIIYLAGMLSISPDYYEAAKIDGASKLQQIQYITIPSIVPLITILTLLQIGRIFYADFGLFFNVTRDTGLLYSTTDVIDTYVYRSLRVIGDIGMASATGFYQAIVGFLLVFISNWIVRKYDREQALF